MKVERTRREKEELFEKASPASKSARKNVTPHRRGYSDEADMDQDQQLALWEGLDSYDPDRGTSPRAYGKKIMYNAALNSFISKAGPTELPAQINGRRVQELLHAHQLDGGSLDSVSEDGETRDAPDTKADPALLSGRGLAARRLLDYCTPKEARMLRLSSQGLSYEQIGYLFGIERQAVHQRIAKARARIPMTIFKAA